MEFKHKIIANDQTKVIGDLSISKSKKEAIKYFITNICVTKRITKHEIATYMGFSEGHLRNILSGKYGLKKRHIFKLVKTRYPNIHIEDFISSLVYIKELKNSEIEVSILLLNDEKVIKGDYDSKILFKEKISDILRKTKKELEIEINEVINSHYLDIITWFKKKYWAEQEGVSKQENEAIAEWDNKINEAMAENGRLETENYYDIFYSDPTLAEIVTKLNGTDESFKASILDIIRILQKGKED